MAQEKKSVRITDITGEKSAPGTLTLVTWDQKSRLSRALKIGGILWGLAFCAVLIPLLHFFLVPALLLAGPVVAGILYSQTHMVQGGQGKCPSCGAALKIEKMKANFPLSDLCTECRHEVRITLA